MLVDAVGFSDLASFMNGAVPMLRQASIAAHPNLTNQLDFDSHPGALSCSEWQISGRAGGGSRCWSAVLPFVVSGPRSNLRAILNSGVIRSLLEVPLGDVMDGGCFDVGAEGRLQIGVILKVL
jgi:hypothetical protein